MYVLVLVVEKQHSEHIRAYLNSQLEQRMNKNSKYSLRAFAKYLDFEPSFLSKLLSGKRSITTQTYQKITTKLGVPASHFLGPGEPENKKTEVHQIQIDEFKMISDWYHFAILELIQTKNFKFDIEWIAQQLKINSHEANQAILRLENLGYLKIKNKKIKILKIKNSTLSINQTATALKDLQKHILNQAIDAIDFTPFDERIQITMTSAIDSDLLPEAKNKVRIFLKELTRFLESGKKRDRVFQTSISMFPVQIKRDQ